MLTGFNIMSLFYCHSGNPNQVRSYSRTPLSPPMPKKASPEEQKVAFPCLPALGRFFVAFLSGEGWASRGKVWPDKAFFIPKRGPKDSGKLVTRFSSNFRIQAFDKAHFFKKGLSEHLWPLPNLATLHWLLSPATFTRGSLTGWVPGTAPGGPRGRGNEELIQRASSELGR